MEAVAVSSTMPADRSKSDATVRGLLQLNAAAYRLAARMLGSPEDAEDVVQQSYLAAFQQVGAGLVPEDERTWFLRVVANQARKHRRNEANRRRREAAVMREGEVVVVAGPEGELIPALRRAMEALEEKHRVPLALCYEEGLSQREAAAVLEMPESTVSKHVNEGLSRLRESLGRAGYAAAPAAILGALTHTAPPVPATLAAALEKLVAGQVAIKATGAAVISAAAKGGIAMKIVAGVVAAGVLAGTVGVLGSGFRVPGSTRNSEPGTLNSAPAEGKPAPVNEYKGMQEREEVFEFAQKPTATKQGDKVVINFASKGACDATVAVVGPDGKVVRHLASGVLGKNAPAPFQQNSLSQKLEWDGKDDDGKPAPAGCKVRVSLGLKAEFEKIEKRNLFSSIKGMTVDKDGLLYVAMDNTIQGESIYAFDRQGRLVRTIWPPSAAVPPERLSILAWNKTAKGRAVPVRHTSGGGWNFSLLGMFFDNYYCTSRTNAVTAVPGGRILCLSAGGERSHQGSRLFFMDAKDGSSSAEGFVDLKGVWTFEAAASPDGKWIYFGGKVPGHGSPGTNHAVQRSPMDKPGAPTVFVGEVAKSGNDNTHFNTPTSVACDVNGNVYVADTGNKRIQVFKPDGSHLKTIPDAPYGTIVVSHKTGAIYGLARSDKGWLPPLVIAKLTSLDNPAKAAEIVIGLPKGAMGWGNYARMAADPTADPPAVWFAASYSRHPETLVKIEDRGDKLVQTVDAVTANGLSSETGEGDGGLDSHQYYIAADKRSGQLAYANAVGPDGLWYSRAEWPGLEHWIVRLDTKKNGYVPFDVDGKRVRNPWGASTHNGKPVIGIEVEAGAHGPHGFQSPFDVAPNGDIYAMTTTGKRHLGDMTKAGIFNTGKPDAFQQLVLVYGPDGKMKCPAALTGLVDCDGIRVGRSGAVYLVPGAKPLGQPLPDGLAPGGKFDSRRWSALVKFNSAYDKYPIGWMVGMWQGKDAEGATHDLNGRKVKLENSLWSYGGVSPVSAAAPSSCTCLKSSFDLDFYERSFVPAMQTYTVNVIDANGNVAARLGGYGNLSDLAAGKPPAFAFPRSVAATDDALWVHDCQQRAIVKSKLSYAAEETVPVP